MRPVPETAAPTPAPAIPKPAIPTSRASTERVVTTKELLAGAHRIWIEHAAERYLLQVTRSGKLILTK
jgi:hemin uptake protein HemP